MVITAKFASKRGNRAEKDDAKMVKANEMVMVWVDAHTPGRFLALVLEVNGNEATARRLRARSR